MKFLEEKLKGTGWNERVLTYEDFELTCEDEGILILHLPFSREGLYGVCEDIPVIVLNENLRSIKKVEVAWHELAHHFLHTPALCCFSKDLKRKYQFEAQVVAVCALIPKPLIEPLLRSDDLSEYPEKLLEFRLKVLDIFNI